MIRFEVGNLANISDEKLYAPIKNVRLVDKEYIEWAKEIAMRIVEFDPTGEKTEYKPTPNSDLENKLAEIRLAATDDRDILKGDFVILCYVDLFRQQKQQGVEGKGKFLKMSDKLIQAIFENHRDGGNVTEFCAKKRITRTKYYRVLNVKFKQERDVERVRGIKERVLGEQKNVHTGKSIVEGKKP